MYSRECAKCFIFMISCNFHTNSWNSTEFVLGYRLSGKGTQRYRNTHTEHTFLIRLGRAMTICRCQWHCLENKKTSEPQELKFWCTEVLWSCFLCHHFREHVTLLSHILKLLKILPKVYYIAFLPCQKADNNLWLQAYCEHCLCLFVSQSHSQGSLAPAPSHGCQPHLQISAGCRRSQPLPPSYAIFYFSLSQSEEVRELLGLELRSQILLRYYPAPSVSWTHQHSVQMSRRWPLSRLLK